MWALCERTQCSLLYFSQTLCCLHPKLNSGAWRHNKGFLRGGPAAAGLSPLFFLSRWSGIRLRRWVQHYLGPVSMSLRWVAFSRAWAAVLGLGVWLNSWRRGFWWLLSWRLLGATRIGCRAGTLGQEVSYCLGRLLCGCEAFSKALYCRTKQAVGGDRRVEEGDLIRILHLRQVQPQVALEHHKTGHGSADHLVCYLGGAQGQVRCTA